MLILSKIEFIEEVKAEMGGYEEITEELIEKWVVEFEKYIKRKSLKDKRISFRGDRTFVKLDDETDLFKIVDKYFVAIENEEQDQYWLNWSL